LLAPAVILTHFAIGRRDPAMFEQYLARWGLTPDGEPIATRSSRLLPVRRAGVPAMLKLAVEEEERQGSALMVWWNGDGAARVLAHDGDAILLECATGAASLAGMARCGRDDEATCVICAAGARLHAPRDRPLPPLVPLARWFGALEAADLTRADILPLAAATARELLSDPRDVVVLHGDLHHDNVLDFGPRGWLAIDPKGLLGERGFDFANLLRNPDQAVATTPGRLARQASVIAEAAGLERGRLLKWVLALAGLSAAWIFDGGGDPSRDLAIAALAAGELAASSG
jgi:streptomycin 6-kinase